MPRDDKRLPILGALAGVLAVVLALAVAFATGFVQITSPTPKSMCRSVRGSLFVDIHEALRAPTGRAQSVEAALAAIAAQRGTGALACPACRKPYLVNPDVATWLSRTSDEEVAIACRGPHSRGEMAALHFSTF